MKIEDLRKRPFNLDDGQIEWVKKTFSSMSDDEKIGQLFTLVSYGYDERYLDMLLKKYKIGGLMFRQSPAEEISKTVKYLQENSKIPLLIAANLEAGANGLSSDGTKVGCQLSVAACEDNENVAAILGDVSGKEARALGCNWAFAPICDIDSNWRNPITNTRTFGSDLDTVKKCTRSYIQACQAQGVATAAKHFPGDGQDERDQHISASVNSLSAEEWDKTYGEVYREAIEAGTKTIMAGHIMQPAWTRKINPSIKDEDILPATLSKELLQGLLRGHLGFNGLIISDASLMGGFAIAMSRKLAVPSCIEAGIDVFLFSRNMDEDLNFMKEGFSNGTLSKERLDEAVLRILALKASLKLNDGWKTIPDLNDYQEARDEDQSGNFLAQTADKSITLVKNRQDIFPITPEHHKRVLFHVISKPSKMKFAQTGASDAECRKLAEKMREKGFEVTVFNAMEKGFRGLTEPVSCTTENFDLIIYCANIATMSNQSVVRIEWSELAGMDVPNFINDVPTVFISLANPYHLIDVSRIKTYINCYQSDDEVLDALVDKMMGNSEFKGKSPVDAFCGKWDTRL